MLDKVNPEGPALSTSRPSPWNPMRSIRRFWWWAVPTGILLASVAAYTTCQSFEPQFVGTSLLEANNDALVFEDIHPSIPDLAESEKTVLFSPLVLEAVLADPKLRTAPSLSDPRHAENHLFNNLSVTSAGSDLRMKVCYQDTDGDAAAMVCNAVVDAYLRQRSGFDSARNRNLERWIEPELQRWELEVEQRQAKVAKLSQQLYGKSASAADRELTINSVTQLGSKLSDLETRLAVLDAQLSLDESSDEPQTKDAETPPNAQQAHTPQSMKRERDLLAVEMEVVQSRFAEQQLKLNRMQRFNAELEFAKAELDVASAVLNKLRTRLAILRTEYRPGGAVRLLLAATPPHDPVNSPPVKRAALFSGIAFLSPLMLGFLLGFRREA